MKIHRKTKNGYLITLKEWSSVVIITDKATGNEVGREEFSDYVKAYLVWQKL
jgi:hypothetical protein